MARSSGQETDAMETTELDDFALEEDVIGEEADDWDEETLGLDWNEADTQSVVSEVIPARGFAD
jgi:hypothetical protein